MSDSTIFGMIVLVLGGVALSLMCRWMDRVEARLLDIEEELEFSGKSYPAKDMEVKP